MKVSATGQLSDVTSLKSHPLPSDQTVEYDLKRAEFVEKVAHIENEEMKILLDKIYHLRTVLVNNAEVNEDNILKTGGFLSPENKDEVEQKMMDLIRQL